MQGLKPIWKKIEKKLKLNSTNTNRPVIESFNWLAAWLSG